MTDREKLYDLIVDAENELYKEKPYHEDGLRIYRVVDYLIENGVTVRQMQKPIAETDLGKYIDAPVWFEELGRDVEELPLLLDGIGIYYAEFKEFGEIERLDRRIDYYNFQWRCWAEKPTDEEREAAEWES